VPELGVEAGETGYFLRLQNAPSGEISFSASIHFNLAT